MEGHDNVESANGEKGQTVVEEKAEQDDKFGVIGTKFGGKWVTNVNVIEDWAGYRSVGVRSSLFIRNFRSVGLHQMGIHGGRRGQYQRSYPDDQKTYDDQFGPWATYKRLNGSHNGRVPVEAESRQSEDGNAY